MARLMILVLLMCAGVAAEFRTLWYEEVMSSGAQSPQQRVINGFVDDVHFVHYNSKPEPRQEWMTRLTDKYPERPTDMWFSDLQVQMMILEEVTERSSQTRGVHWVQRQSRCMWDDETEEVIGHHRFAYDGKDFIAFYLEKKEWVALTPDAENIKRVLNSNVALTRQVHHYLTQECPEQLKLYLEYGSHQLLKKECPTMCLLQKTASSPITCLATGFFPKHSELYWTKDGEVMSDGMQMTETLPNHDGTFQRKAVLLHTPVRPEDQGRYECVFRSYSERAVIRRLEDGLDTNRNSVPNNKTTVIIPIIIIMFTMLIIIIITIIIIIFIPLWLLLFVLRRRKLPDLHRNGFLLSHLL